jgi:ribonuclease R
MDAERESIKYKQVEFMEKHVGMEFEGYVSGMIDRGIFVELKDNKCEGLVGFESMEEPFEIEEGRLRAKGLRSKKVIKMGDAIKVRIVETNLAKRQIEMELA